MWDFEGRQRDDDNDKDKLSWRELDRKRDGGYSRHGVESDRQRPAKREDAAHKLALEALFKPGGKKSAAETKSLKAIKQAKTSGEINAGCLAYIESHGLPSDLDTLLYFLDSTANDVLLPVLAHLKKGEKHMSDSGKKMLLQRLRVLNMMVDDHDVIEKADQLMQNLED